ncbi:MAG: class I SAM-dependent methyltransferase [Prevotellaceae bacterium]|jgi:ubiquinone/menaquinone biosynthesis C-methylase UbiE|nr:class I SAM-dependent methyltransferase [Prevotellaceae bacterium]
MKKNLINHEIAHGEKISHDAEKIWGWSSVAGQKRAERRAKYFIDLGEINRDSAILEIGCGTGIFTQKIYSATSADITAVDVSPALLEQARTKMPDVKFLEEDAMSLSFEDNTFDVVYGSSVLHHLDMPTALSEFYRVLRSTANRGKPGKLIFAEPNMLNPQIFIQKNVPCIKRWMGDSPDETAIIRFSMTKLLQKTGYKNVRVFPYDFLHPAIPHSLTGIFSAIGQTIEKIPLLKEIAGSVIIYAEKQ